MRRSDAYESRARALAVLAGQDADARVAGPGGKLMPAWCNFRDAARAEHSAAEAAALVLPPQAAAFQNAPIQVFGQHDDATIAQMRNCVGVGNVVAGVVCADGHLGYAQPVGSVIASDRLYIRGQSRPPSTVNGRLASHHAETQAHSVLTRC